MIRTILAKSTAQRASFQMECLEDRQLLSTGSTATLLYDHFGGSRVNSHNWHMLASWTPDLGRTHLRCSQDSAPPPVSGGAVHLTLDTYNPRTVGWFWGSQLISNATFRIGSGLEVKVRANLNSPIAGGVVGGLFMYMFKHGSVNPDEVDTELLSNQVTKANKVETNAYTTDGSAAGSPRLVALPHGGKLTSYHTYQMSILPGQVSWYVDGQLVRTENKSVPTGPMQMYLNLWAPGKTFGDAYDAVLKPASGSHDNKRFTMDVDYVVVRSINPAPVAKPGIKITSVPPLGATTNAYVTGKVTGKLSDYQGVGVYINVGGGWWSKPTLTDPVTSIASDGTWSANVVTGGIDEQAREIRAYLLPVGFNVPLASGESSLPTTLSSLLCADVRR